MPPQNQDPFDLTSSPPQPAPAPQPIAPPTPQPAPAAMPRSAELDAQAAAIPSQDPFSSGQVIAPAAAEPTPQQFQAEPQPVPPQPFQPPQAPQTQPAGAWPPSDAQPYATQPKSGKKKLIVPFIILVVLLMLMGGVYAFAFYIPNRPENVWSNGVNRSGQALKALVEKSTAEDNAEKFTKSDIALDIEATAQEQTYNGSFVAKVDGNNTNGNLKFATSGGEEQLSLGADLISKVAEGNQLPDSYVRLNGLKQLASLGILPKTYNKYDNKWIAIEAEYLETILSPEDIEQQKEQLSTADITELTNAFMTPTLDRVFSTEPDKAVFENREFVGKEDVDGKATYHYKVGVNKENFVAYCKAAAESVMSTSAYQKTPFAQPNNLQQEKDAAMKSCDESGADIKTEDVFDLWIDNEQKIIYKVRFTDKEQPDAYVDIGQNYDGGDNIEFFAHYHDGQSQTDANFTISTNLSSGSTTGKVQVENKGQGFPYTLTVTLTAKPYDGEVDTTTPEPNIPIQKILKELGLQ